MSSLLKMVMLGFGLLSVSAVIRLLVRRRLSERNSFLWLLGAVAVLALATFPGILEILADLLGVDYPPALLFLLSTFMILAIVLHQSIEISSLQSRLRELVEQVAVMNYQQQVREEQQRDLSGSNEP